MNDRKPKSMFNIWYSNLSDQLQALFKRQATAALAFLRQASLTVSWWMVWSHKTPDPETMETPEPPSNTPKRASKQVATWHPCRHPKDS